MITQFFRALFWLTLLFVLFMSILVSQPVPLISGIDDKILHAASFAALAGLSVLAYPQTSFFRMFMYLMVLGALIEAIQAIPSLARDPNFGDWVADGVGAGSVLIAAANIRWIWRRFLVSNAVA